MPVTLRIFLIIGAVLTLMFFVSNIRRSRLKINHSIFWIFFGTVLLILALIHDSVFRVSELLGFQSPSNLVYLIVIFLLLIKEFSTTMRISKLSEQITSLTQAMAIQQLKEKDGEDKSMQEESAMDPA